MDESNSISKSCTGCHDVKALDEFNKKATGKFGRQPLCRICQKQSAAFKRLADPERARARSRDWYASNKLTYLISLREQRRVNSADICSARRLKYRESSAVRDSIYRWRSLNPEKFRASVAKYAAEHRKESSERARRWRIANPMRTAENARSWISRNPERHKQIARASSACRRARKKGAAGSITRANISKLLRLQKSRCACCSAAVGRGYHVDHVMPLALGGSNEFLNLQILCARCNMRKNAKHPVKFMQEMGFLI